MPERVTLASHPHGPDLAAWLARFGQPRVRDIYALQVAELAEVRLPGEPGQAREAFIADSPAREPGVWSYYPWLDVALRTLEPEALFELRTNRNRNLITTSEQLALRNAQVAIAGLSVGSNVLAALVRHGIGRAFSLADHDTLATSNLNRTPSRLLDVGVPKRCSSPPARYGNSTRSPRAWCTRKASMTTRRAPSWSAAMWCSTK